jgi:capsular exopolysaccharide synthesis family protein
MEQLPGPEHPLGRVPENIPSSYSRGYPTNTYSASYTSYPDLLQEDPAPEAKSGSLIDYWRILKRHKGTVILITFMGPLAALLATFPQTPVYRARASIEIQSINNDFLNVKQLNPVTEDWTATGALADLQTQIKIIQSESLVDQVVDKFKSAGKAGPLETAPGTFVTSVKKALRLQPVDSAGLEYRIRQRALKALTVRQIGQTRMVDIMFDSEDAHFASDFVDTLVSGYIESNIQARWQMSERTAHWLSRQLDEFRVKLEHSESALQDYARKSGLLYTAGSPSSNAEKTNVSEEKLRQVQQELSRAQADRAIAKSRYDTAKTAPPDTVADVLNDVSLRELQAKIIDLRRQETELIAIYTPKYEKVRRIEAQIPPLEAAFNKARAAILGRIYNDYQAAIARESLLQADFAAQSTIVTDQAEKSIQYNILKREVDSNRQLYDSMLQQVNQSRIASAMRASNIRIVDPAKVPYKPYSPDYLLNCGLGLLSGLLAGVAVALMRERADRTLQEPGDIEFWTRVPEMGVIPSAALGAVRRPYHTATKSTRLIQQDVRSDGTPATNALVIETPKKNHANQAVEFMTWHNKGGLVAEAFRTVLTSIMFSGENGSRPRLLVLTSASPKEGKSTVVSNLGIALAEIRQRVLVIDADLRKPRLHEIFNLPNQVGLSDLLQSHSVNSDLHLLVSGMILETSVPGLSVLPSGPPAYAAANLLYSPVLAEMFAQFRKDYDMILVDTPPSLQMTDARVAGRLADGVIFVTRAGRTTRDAAIAAHQRFADDRIRVLGTILNDWNPSKSPNGYYGYHRDLYGKHYAEYYGK